MNEESISERNSMSPPYRFYTSEEISFPLTEAELELANKRRKELQAKHEKTDKINLWEEFEK